MTSLRIIAADHPSVDHDVDRFLDGLRGERRYFGPTARANPKPFPSLIDALRRGTGMRLAAMVDGAIVGVVRVDHAGEVAIAVAAEHRGRGVGTSLGRAALERAIGIGHRRLVLRTSRRSRAARRIGESLGCTVVDVGYGRTELILDLVDTAEHIA